jgi:electron transfer flavoprotein alpha subunit
MLKIIKEKCNNCGICAQSCVFGYIDMENGFPVVSETCTMCGVCAGKCPVQAIVLTEEKSLQIQDLAEYAGFWVVTQFDETGKLNKASLELLSKSRELADKKGCKVEALVLREELNEEIVTVIAETGCDGILHYQNRNLDRYDTHAYTVVISNAIQEKKPEVVLFAATEIGRDLAPRIACRIKTGLTADCTGLDIDDKGNLVQIRPTYGGNIMATIVTPYHRPQMATIRPNVMQLIKHASRNIIKETISVQFEGGVEKLCSQIMNEMSFMDVSESGLIITGGYGLRNAANFQWIYKVASKLNAAAGATRKAVDEGWAPAAIQIGQTGKTVAPELYMAFGVSGALQHVIGIKYSKRIIAVNNDPVAPIFNFCNVAILGDAVEILKVLHTML